MEVTHNQMKHDTDYRLSYEYPGGNHIYIVLGTVHILLRVDTICTDTRPYSKNNMCSGRKFTEVSNLKLFCL